MDYSKINTPYNTLNLPEGKIPDLTNPQMQKTQKTQKTKIEKDTNFYDPTKSMVSNYLKDNMTMYDNRGKYFDSYLFNQKFDEYIKEKTAERKLKEQVQLYDLDSIENIQVQPYQLPLDKLLINFKNIWFELFDDLIEGKKPTNLFIINNFFYFGITFIVIFILYIMLSYIFE